MQAFTLHTKNVTFTGCPAVPSRWRLLRTVTGAGSGGRSTITNLKKIDRTRELACAKPKISFLISDFRRGCGGADKNEGNFDFMCSTHLNYSTRLFGSAISRML